MQIENLCIFETSSLKEALKKLDQSGARTLLVVNQDHCFIGTLSDGDIRRHLLAGKDLDQTVYDAYHKNSYFYYVDAWSQDEAKALFLKEKIELIPILNKDHRIESYMTWDMLFENHDLKKNRKIDIPVFIMAGGKGTRMEPFTKILPKPLIPIGEKPIIQVIMENFNDYGVYDFYISLNHKADMVQSYLTQLDTPFNMRFLIEKEFRGTAWSLRLAQDQIYGTFLVSNCDILIQTDYADILDFHRSQNASLTLVTSVQTHIIPYGVVEFEKGGVVKEIKEKPEQTVVVNTGVYLLEHHVLQHIPAEQHFDMTDLVNLLISKGNKVVTYPVTEKQFMDIGQWDEYKKTTRLFNAVINP
jgi:dTDP-glucose pyrophosphorylase